MRKKLTTLLFGLLLAVGWTSSAFAQPATYSAESIKNLTYEWADASGTHNSPYVILNEETGRYEAELVTNPYQIYGLLRGVYMEKALPGPYLSAYTSDDKREDPAYYGAIAGGWEIPAGAAAEGPMGDITITTTRGNQRYVQLSTITVYAPDNSVLTSWDAATNGTTIPRGWSRSTNFTRTTADGVVYYYMQAATGTITISSSLLNGNTSVRVEIKARRTGNNANLTVNGQTQSFANNNTLYTFNVSLTGTSTNYAYKPNNEGYTAVMVAVKNDAQPDAMSTSGAQYTTRTQVIDYITRNIESVKLLTDGLRIGEGYNAGTVFNCDGTYNKFFILGKAQARKKAPGVSTNPSYTGEEVPFKFMFEQFSPTTGDQGSQIDDFYSEMMNGRVYNVVHDCASVMQLKHQFSMTGNTGTEKKSFTGLNFLIPDYRLKYWKDSFNYRTYRIDYWGDTIWTDHGTFDVDGRDLNPYYEADDNGKLTSTFRDATSWAAYWGQYNQDYAPKMGIYLITLEAAANKVDGYSETNRFYNIDLNWVSSLNEMAGEGTVAQKYVVYEVKVGQDGKEYLDSLTTVTDLTTWSILNYPQPQHSETRTFIIKGWPTASTHPSFIAWSNRAQVVIPGYDDFMALKLHHYESDFVVSEEKNYYRNFLQLSSEGNENALSISSITASENPKNSFTLYRCYDEEGAATTTEVPIAELTFQVQGDPATAKYVHFGVTYDANNPQEILRPDDKPLKYTLQAMGVKAEGDLCVHGNGDFTIQPNSTKVNFHSITVKRGSTELASWTGGNLPNGWTLSPGSTWTEFEGAYYIEGGGYIIIPASVFNGNYNNVTVTINASADAGSISRITVNDWTKTINGTEGTDYEWTAAQVAQQLFDDGVVKLGGLPIVDQLTASTAENKHPDKYVYVLKYKPGTTDEKQSGTVEVPVQHTGSVVNGYYSKSQVDNDMDRSLTPDVLNADMMMNLSDINSDIYYYTILGSKEKNSNPENEETYYISNLQRRENFTYREMLESSPMFVEEPTFGYAPGEFHYKNDKNVTTGNYGDFITYVPMVVTKGFDRRWYEVGGTYGDHLHNTYGAPLWESSVGKVEIGQESTILEREDKSQWSQWTGDGQACCLYRLHIDANCFLPNPEVTNVAYEPYMMRVWVTCPGGGFRDYEIGPNGYPIDKGAISDTIMWLKDIPIQPQTGTGVEYYNVQFGKIGDNGNGAGDYPADQQLVFGALKSAEPNVIVRFYYKAKGGASGLRGSGDEYNGSEGFIAPTPKSAIYELVIEGDVVSKTYINAQGMKSDKPFNGVNIVVTRYSDGTVVTTKEVKY